MVPIMGPKVRSMKTKDPPEVGMAEASSLWLIAPGITTSAASTKASQTPPPTIA